MAPAPSKPAPNQKPKRGGGAPPPGNVDTRITIPLADLFKYTTVDTRTGMVTITVKPHCKYLNEVLSQKLATEEAERLAAAAPATSSSAERYPYPLSS